MKGLRKGEKGFTLIELLIVVAILGILAAVIVPNLAGFLSTGNVAAANTEVSNVESAALAYYANNNGAWPDDSDALTTDYLSAATKYATYGFDAYGQVNSATEIGTVADDAGIEWDGTNFVWIKSS